MFDLAACRPRMIRRPRYLVSHIVSGIVSATMLLASVAQAEWTEKDFDEVEDGYGTDFVDDEARFPELQVPVRFTVSAPPAPPSCVRPTPANAVQTIREITQQIQVPPPLPPGRPATEPHPPFPPPRSPELSNCALTKVLASAKQNVRHRWGNRANSGGQCALGVRGSLQGSLVGGVVAGLGNAIDYLKNLKPHGFVDSGLRDPERAPPGAIIVFAGANTAAYLRSGETGSPLGNWVGHVTIKGDDGFYYTDARTREAAVGWSGGRNVRRVRTVAGIFVPGPPLAARYANQCVPTRLAANH